MEGAQTPNLDPNLGPPPATGITNRLLDRRGLGNQLASVMRVRTAPRPGLWLLSLAPMCSDVCCQIAAKNDLLPLVVTSKGGLTRIFVVAGGGFERPTSGI